MEVKCEKPDAVDAARAYYAAVQSAGTMAVAYGVNQWINDHAAALVKTAEGLDAIKALSELAKSIRAEVRAERFAMLDEGVDARDVARHRDGNWDVDRGRAKWRGPTYYLPRRAVANTLLEEEG